MRLRPVYAESETNKKEAIEVNVNGVKNLVEVCEEKKIKMILNLKMLILTNTQEFGIMGILQKKLNQIVL